MSGAMAVQTAVGITPSANRPLLSSVLRAVWYPLHQAAGTSVQCSLGNGPALTLNGTEGSLWSASWGAATPDGVAHRLVSPGDDVYLTALCRLDNIEGQELLIGFEIEHDGAMTAGETILSWGNQAIAAGRVGGWRIGMLASTQQEFISAAGEGASGIVGSGFLASASSGITARTLTAISIKGVGPKTVMASRHSWRMGTGLQSVGATSPSTLNLVANGGQGIFAGNGSALALFARLNVSTWESYLGAAAGSNAKLNNVWLARMAAVQTGLVERCLLDMAAAPREFPLSLRG